MADESDTQQVRGHYDSDDSDDSDDKGQINMNLARSRGGFLSTAGEAGPSSGSGAAHPDGSQTDSGLPVGSQAPCTSTQVPISRSPEETRRQEKIVNEVLAMETENILARYGVQRGGKTPVFENVDTEEHKRGLV